MSVNFSKVRLLRNEQINPGDRWIYVADFNEKPKKGIVKYDRVDIELEDLLYILNKGASVVILAHRGRYRDCEEDTDLSFLVPYLSKRLIEKTGEKIDVKYHQRCIDRKAKSYAKNLKQGEVLLLGSTRQYSGEEENDLSLAKEFSELGEKVAVGGFGKTHRENASNHKILHFLPGYLTESHRKEIELLDPWAGKQKDSIAVLGGIKKEKITMGLEGLVTNYDYIIPGGIVLNTVLLARDYKIGKSIISEKEETPKEVDERVNRVRQILRENENKIKIPEMVLVAKKTDYGYTSLAPINLTIEEVPKESMIVSFILSHNARNALEEIISANGRILLAGTPDLYKEGLGLATAEVIEALKRVRERGLILGGDTASEIQYDEKKYRGKVSTGGGSSLYFLAHNTTPVFEKLKENKEKFEKY